MGMRKRKEKIAGLKILDGIIKNINEGQSTPPDIDIPYPNTEFASDTTSGSKKVKIDKSDVSLKNRSNYKKSQGDEPSTTQTLRKIFTRKKTRSRNKT
jgi:hypothetical protein